LSEPRWRLGRALTEYGLQQYILTRMQARGLVTSSPPIAAVNAHSADPHYAPESRRDQLLIRTG
jgi:Xaa-Pro dipeptidase